MNIMNCVLKEITASYLIRWEVSLKDPVWQVTGKGRDEGMTRKKREAGNFQEVGGSEGSLLVRSALMLGWLRDFRSLKH